MKKGRVDNMPDVCDMDHVECDGAEITGCICNFCKNFKIISKKSVDLIRNSWSFYLTNIMYNFLRWITNKNISDIS